jgi:hypothetical protein
MELSNSKRLLYSASYVTTQLTPEDQRQIDQSPGGGFQKANLLRALGLTQTDLGLIRQKFYSGRSTAISEADFEQLASAVTRLFEPGTAPSTVELAALLAPVPQSVLLEFAKFSAAVLEDIGIDIGVLVGLLEKHFQIAPIGRLHLERIEVYPAGLQRGELVFSVPMAPGETVTISHKEWSTSSQEYEDIVQDYFESYSERGVAEKTDASMSAENENRHSNAFNFGASLSGGFAGVTLTTSIGLSNTAEDREAAKQSMQRTREITEKASARTRKEHKVSIKLETKKGVDDSSIWGPSHLRHCNPASWRPPVGTTPTIGRD